MAISRVQTKTNHVAAGTSNPVTFDSSVTAGNLIVVYTWKAEASDVAENYVAGDLTKTGGTATIGTIALDVDADVLGVTSYRSDVAVYSVPVTGTGTLTLTLAGFYSSGCYSAVAITEYSGADVTGTRLAGTNEATFASGTTALSTGTVASGMAALFAGCGSIFTSGGTTTITPDSNFTTVWELENGDVYHVGSAIERIVTSNTTDTAEWTRNNENTGGNSVVLAVYKEAAGAGGRNPVPMGFVVG